MGQDRRAVGEVEAAGVEGGELGFEDEVVLGELLLVVGTGKGQAGEEDVIECLEAGRGGGEDVFRGKVGQGGEQGEDGTDEENVERTVDGSGDGLDGYG